MELRGKNVQHAMSGNPSQNFQLIHPMALRREEDIVGAKLATVKNAGYSNSCTKI